MRMKGQSAKRGRIDFSVRYEAKSSSTSSLFSGEEVEVAELGAGELPPDCKIVAVEKAIVSGLSVEEQLAQQNLYKTELCHLYCETGRCRYGNSCRFAHGAQELRPRLQHPKYKTEICRSYHVTGHCKYGHRCRFIHENATPLVVSKPNEKMEQLVPQDAGGPVALEPPSPGTPPAVAPATVTAFSSSSSSFSAPLVKQPLVVCETQPAVLTTSPSAPAGLPHIVFQAQPSPSSMPTSLKVPLPLSQLHGGGVSSASATPLMTSAGGTQAPAAHAPQRGSRKGRGRPTSRDVVFSSPRASERTPPSAPRLSAKTPRMSPPDRLLANALAGLVARSPVHSPTSRSLPPSTPTSPLPMSPAPAHSSVSPVASTGHSSAAPPPAPCAPLIAAKRPWAVRSTSPLVLGSAPAYPPLTALSPPADGVSPPQQPDARAELALDPVSLFTGPATSGAPECGVAEQSVRASSAAMLPRVMGHSLPLDAHRGPLLPGHGTARGIGAALPVSILPGNGVGAEACEPSLVVAREFSGDPEMAGSLALGESTAASWPFGAALPPPPLVPDSVGGRSLSTVSFPDMPSDEAFGAPLVVRARSHSVEALSSLTAALSAASISSSPLGPTAVAAVAAAVAAASTADAPSGPLCVGPPMVAGYPFPAPMPMHPFLFSVPPLPPLPLHSFSSPPSSLPPPPPAPLPALKRARPELASAAVDAPSSLCSAGSPPHAIATAAATTTAATSTAAASTNTTATTAAGAMASTAAALSLGAHGAVSTGALSPLARDEPPTPQPSAKVALNSLFVQSPSSELVTSPDCISPGCSTPPRPRALAPATDYLEATLAEPQPPLPPQPPSATSSFSTSPSSSASFGGFTVPHRGPTKLRLDAPPFVPSLPSRHPAPPRDIISPATSSTSLVAASPVELPGPLAPSSASAPAANGMPAPASPRADPTTVPRSRSSSVSSVLPPPPAPRLRTITSPSNLSLPPPPRSPPPLTSAPDWTFPLGSGAAAPGLAASPPGASLPVTIMAEPPTVLNLLELALPAESPPQSASSATSSSSSTMTAPMQYTAPLGVRCAAVSQPWLAPLVPPSLQTCSSAAAMLEIAASARRAPALGPPRPPVPLSPPPVSSGACSPVFDLPPPIYDGSSATAEGSAVFSDNDDDAPSLAAARLPLFSIRPAPGFAPAPVLCGGRPLSPPPLAPNPPLVVVAPPSDWPRTPDMGPEPAAHEAHPPTPPPQQQGGGTTTSLFACMSPLMAPSFTESLGCLCGSPTQGVDVRPSKP